MNGNGGRRVAVIGLDAAERTLIERLIEGGDLPNLARIRARSARCELESEATWRSGRVWETFLTGVADWPSAVVFDPKTYDTYQLGARRKRPFYATDPPASVLALDVPYMSLWHEVPGAQVTAWGGHDAGYPRASHPPGTLRDIDARFGAHPAYLSDFSVCWHHPPAIEKLAGSLVAGAARRAEVFSYLHWRFPDWDLAMTVMSEAHSAGEFLWHGIDPDHPLATFPTASEARARLLEVYRAIDTAVGRIAAAMPPDVTLVVCSLHGMQRNEYDLPSMVMLPELLHRLTFGRGLLRDASPDGLRNGQRYVPLGPGQRWNAYIRQRFADGPRARLARAGRLTFPMTAARVRALRRRLRRRRGAGGDDHEVRVPPETDLPPERIEEPLERLDWQIPVWYRPHWPRMRAFALPVFYDARVRINLRGRERDGIVEREDYAAACAEVVEAVRAVRNARTGAPVVDEITMLRAEDPMDPDGPDADIVVTWAGGADAFVHPDAGVIGPFPFRRTGGHTANGFAYVSGPGIQAGDLGERSALDLTPTLAGLLGGPPQDGFDGRPILIPERAG